VRVVLVSDCFLPRLGGIEVQVAGLAAQLRGLGHQVVVLTASPGPDTAGVVRIVPPVPLPVNPWAGPALGTVIAGADVVHAHLGIVAPFASHAVEVAQRLQVPTVVTWHSMLGRVGPLVRYAARWRTWVRSGAVPTAVSAAAATQLQQVVGEHGRVLVLHNGIDPADWAAPGPVPPGPTVRVLSAMRFAGRKRPLALLRLARLIRSRLPDQVPLQVEVPGEGPLLPVVRALVARLDMEPWLLLPGRLCQAELARRYHRAHLYLSPSRLESFGIAALEARTAGLPVAGLRGSGIEEFVHDGVTGVLARDDAGLALRVGDLLMDRARLDDIARHNRTTEPAQVWPRVIEVTLTAYDRGRTVRAAPARD